MNTEMKQKIRVKPALCVLAHAGTEAKKSTLTFSVAILTITVLWNSLRNMAVMISRNTIASVVNERL